MKKAMILFVLVFIVSLMACNKNDDVKQNWIFTVTTVISISPAMEGYPMSSTLTVEQSNLTENEAEDVLKAYNTTSSVTNGGYTLTTITTATKEVKK